MRSGKSDRATDPALGTMRRAPTILDVAQNADVSKSTVSNVIRGVQGVTTETRRKVFDAIEALGYRPNVMARQLVQRRTSILGVVVGDLSNPFHAEMAKQVERHAAARGYLTIFCNTQSDEKASLASLESLLDYRVAAILFLAYSGSSDRIRKLLEGTLPVAFVTCSSGWGDCISGDDERGGEMATDHLLALGHRRIAYIADPIVEDAADYSRQLGYQRAMRRAGFNPTVYHWLRPSEKLLRGREEIAIADVIGGKDPVTAVFSSNDLGAIELLDIADRLGVAVPADLSVVGFDDVILAGLARIGLTTVSQPQEELARLALETVVARLSGDLAGGPVARTVPLQLVERSSTGAPQAGGKTQPGDARWQKAG